MAEITPMMRQYCELKEQYKDTLLFYRLGDFYELFFEDAVTASRELELTLTGRDCGLAERAPMCGVPYHSVNTYLNRLLTKGFKVAICEQLTDPKASKGLVERDVVRIITPGTVIEETMLDQKAHNYICAVQKKQNTAALAWADVSTGDFYATLLEGGEADALLQLNGQEILIGDSSLTLEEQLRHTSGGRLYAFTRISGALFQEKNAKAVLTRHFGADNVPDEPLIQGAAGALLQYLLDTQKNALSHIRELTVIENRSFLQLDANTRRNLELCEKHDRSRRGTLLWVLDQCATSLGSRKLRELFDRPLQTPQEINARLDAVNELYSDYPRRTALREALANVYDVERLGTKIAYGTVNARDCLALCRTLTALPEVISLLCNSKSALLLELLSQLNPETELCALLLAAIAEEPPLSVLEGGIIREGYSKELDEMRYAARHSREYILQLEQTEREQTGIKNLKVGFNKIFGFYIEVSKGNIASVPYRYTRKQTLSNCERYVTPELKQLEETLAGVEEKSVRLEYELFSALREKLLAALPSLQRNARALALTDVLLAFAMVAADNGYCRPQMNTEGRILVEEGRHPVVEQMLPKNTFVPNGVLLNGEEDRFLVITGPNMAGKSTYMRQTALLVFMAHLGCFVPARKADIAICDRIFTRVGASDDLASGQSTFMVEMAEVAAILKHATKNSLVILDEIGRGTSTFDGLSIAWAVTEYLAKPDGIRAKTLFATHYHELSELEGRLEGVKNFSVSVKEHGDEVIFLRRIIRGSADKSFGIQVARLAGLPKEVLKRSREILQKLEDADIAKGQIGAQILAKQQPAPVQTTFFANDAAQEVIKRLLDIDINTLTPVAALNLLCELREQAKRNR